MLIIFAIAMVVLVGITALAIDGSYGFVQNRRAQNASDFAAFAASQQLLSSSYCSGTTQPSTAQVVAVIQKLVDDNDASIGTGWNAKFLYSNGQAIPNSTFSPASQGGSPPPGACGVTVAAAPHWNTFFAGIFGVNQLKGFASGSVSETAKGNPIGIVALNKVGPHEVLGGGTGKFLVSGDIVVNTDVQQQPWTEISNGWAFDDAIDAKTNSDLYVYGTIHTVAAFDGSNPLWPLDWCFDSSGIVGKGNPIPPTPAYKSGDPAAQVPAYEPSCSSGSVTVAYDAIDPTINQISDPLAASGAPPNPFGTPSITACPGQAAPVQYSNVSPTASVLLPGEYTTPVELTGSVTFDDCSGYGEAAYPGVYRFDQGLWINPLSSTATVTANNVVIATENPYPKGGNVPGTLSGSTFTTTGPGNGAPCLPAGTKNSDGRTAEVSTTACTGTNNTLYGAVAWGDKSIAVDSTMTGTGNNFSLIIGGAAGAQVNLTGPTTGPYAGTNGAPGLVLYQDPGTQANYGFNAQSGDAATINVTGVLYNASLKSYGTVAPLDYWDGPGGGIPFYAGGTLQTGFGAGWTTGPTQSAGSVTISGTTIVDDFNTDGATSITILGQPYSLPGGGGLSLIG